jgi:hypothetical protein
MESRRKLVPSDSAWTPTIIIYIDADTTAHVMSSVRDVAKK